MAIAHAHTDTTGDIASLTATTTITKPTGAAATDVLVVVFGDDHNATTSLNALTAPSGWTQIGTTQSVNTPGVQNIQLRAYWALGNVAGLGFTNSQTGASYQQGWTCAAFTGVDNTTPVDATGTGNTNTGVASLTTNAVTVATDQAWHLIALCDWLGKVAFSATSFTETHNAAANASAALLYNTTPKGVGSTGTVAVANSDGTTSGEALAGQPFALRPAAAAAAQVPYDVPHSPQHQALMAM